MQAVNDAVLFTVAGAFDLLSGIVFNGYGKMFEIIV